MFSDFGIPNPFRPNPAGDNKDTERQKLSSKLSKVNAAIEKIEKSILKSTSDSSKKFSLREFSSNLPGIKQFLEKRLVTLKGQRQELESKLKDVQERFLPVESSQNTFENKLQRAVAAKNISTLTSLAENATLSDLRSLPLTLVEIVLQYVPEDKVIKLAASQELMAKVLRPLKNAALKSKTKL